MEFSMQEYWGGLSVPSPGDLPDAGIKPMSSTLQADFLSCEPPTNSGKFLKSWEYHNLPACWETYMQDKKQQLEPDMERQTGSKLGKEHDTTVYCHPAYLTYMQSTSCEMLGWMKHNLESGLLGEISTSSDIQISSVQFSSVPQSCPTLWDPMDCSMPGFPVHHQLPELAQTHVHWVDDVIQPSHPLLSPSPPTFNLFQHQGLFKWVSSLQQVAKVLEFQLQHQSFQCTTRTDLL